MRPLIEPLLSGLAFRLFGVAGKQRLAILIYHRVMVQHDPMRPGEPTREVFDWHMRVISRYFIPLSLQNALRLMEEDRLPDRAVCVTFDDGYADNESVALPILLKWKVPATVFVASGFLDGGRMWNDTVIEVLRKAPSGNFDTRVPGIGVVELDSVKTRLEIAQSIIATIKYEGSETRESLVSQLAANIADLPCDLMLTTSALNDLHRCGVEIGGHTHTHPILAGMADSAAYSEILRGKEELEAKIDAPISYFAYPNGRSGIDYKPAHVEMVKDIGFKGAVSTHWGVCACASDHWQLARFTPWDRDRLRFILRLLFNYRILN